MRCGRLHTFLPGWLQANVAYIMSRGFNMPEERIRLICCPVLLCWGRHDKVCNSTWAKVHVWHASVLCVLCCRSLIQRWRLGGRVACRSRPS
jgi:pimeloyl-ACP methyl ester carboxylesterase